MSEAAGRGDSAGGCSSCGNTEQLYDSLNSLHALVKYLTEKNSSLYEQIADVQRENEILKLEMDFRSIGVNETYEASGGLGTLACLTAEVNPNPNTLRGDGGSNENREREVLRLKAIIGWQKEKIRHLHEQIAATNKDNAQK